ncbi:uncharacterized protein LOC129920891 [Episyrphus balteatus]|uniref:uncharacterized protein LOC129920891 n=1 Tax=Episyrphus balteatus TaxID=286459 RepID=UPI002485E9AE|nr:uncharacterized protein LOC129920891 [Episyrphus balteatus]
MDITHADHLNFSDPHGYCRLVISDNSNRFLIPRKRRNLGNEIQELHIMNDSNVIPPSTTGYFEKALICNFIDDILAAQKTQPCEAEVARRKLFLPSRSVLRKAKTTHKNKSIHLNLFKFQKTHSNKVLRKIKKNYLDEARRNVLSQIASERLVHKRRSSSTSSSQDSNDSRNCKRLRMSTKEPPQSILVNPNFNGMFLVNTDSGVFPIDPSKLSEICKYHDNMVRQHPAKVRTEHEQVKRDLNTEACRLSRRVSKLAGIILEEQYRERTLANNKIVEESIRSIHYLKSLLDMLLERD